MTGMSINQLLSESYHRLLTKSKGYVRIKSNKGRKQNESQINQEICKICIEGNAKTFKSQDAARNPVYIVKTTYYIWYLNCIYKRYKSFLGDPIKDLIWDL